MPVDTVVADLYNRVLLGIQAEILNNQLLPDMGPNVYTQFEENDRNVTFPCVLITLNSDPEEDGDGDGCEAHDWTYSGQLLIAGRDSPDDATKIINYTGYRQTLLTHFRNIATLPGVPECWNVSAKPTVIIDPNNKIYTQVKTGLTVRASCTIPRR